MRSFQFMFLLALALSAKILIIFEKHDEDAKQLYDVSSNSEILNDISSLQNFKRNNNTIAVIPFSIFSDPQKIPILIEFVAGKGSLVVCLTKQDTAQHSDILRSFHLSVDQYTKTVVSLRHNLTHQFVQFDSPQALFNRLQTIQQTSTVLFASFNPAFYSQVSNNSTSNDSESEMETPSKKKVKYTCDSPRQCILPQVTTATISSDDFTTPDFSGVQQRGLWLSMDGYNLMIYIDTCSSDCNTVIEVTTDCYRQLPVTFNGDKNCLISFYGKSGQSYKAHIIATTTKETCHVVTIMKETSETPSNTVNIWLIISTGIFCAILVITATTTVIYIIIKYKRTKRVPPKTDIEVSLN
ncbi:hypothetical protein EIN_197850 [Entamoeba invadens IP1]|uniref:Uncharacterized protein n=1 Tax=Entamoeba invadens IP1 TaxID=370355 RepID=A0A0A1TUQ3_ENTIV|nr:hypothetical protein EIN_197850 [Entamoeba invadens IP1]ELP83842.1 hypothetical protein EIN_197850 [Entamoeba invadens IP1]|eukprot:XP_004183188.1 hypothetical protein EIN_197850 [Entamoeba invadens IP1]